MALGDGQHKFGGQNRSATEAVVGCKNGSVQFASFLDTKCCKGFKTTFPKHFFDAIATLKISKSLERHSSLFKIVGRRWFLHSFPSKSSSGWGIFYIFRRSKCGHRLVGTQVFASAFGANMWMVITLVPQCFYCTLNILICFIVKHWLMYLCGVRRSCLESTKNIKHGGYPRLPETSLSY